MTGTVKATTYLQIAPTRYNGERVNPERGFHDARVVKATQKKSVKPEPGTIEVKITVEIPKAAFLPLAPEDVVVIPEGMTVAHPIVIEAVDPEDVA